MSKLDQLTEIVGYDDPLEMFEEFVCDSVCPGICMNPDCDYTNEVEPDCTNGWCEVCNTQTVKSGMVLGGII
jgi:hypothetical protein